MVTYHSLLKDLHTKLHIHAWQNNLPSSSSIFLAVLAVLLCSTVFSRVAAFFLPLVISTSVCCMAVYLFVVSERGAAMEVVLVSGEKAEVGLLQVYDEVNMSKYGKSIGVGCFLHRSGGGWTKRGVDEDGEDVVFAGRLEAGGKVDGGVLGEDVVSLQVDRLAEGLWNGYFGECSKWNYGLELGELGQMFLDICFFESIRVKNI